ncbi:hypothetical protein GTQ99_00210 [Kineococcus sp. T13]|uniref:hypothetical protein n=1 Tax=Kineococcus vitellinus TaxID=2696565 RepID=UPI0014130FB9|nr:hypothetical protein [Kineococcus vitellinus]NAZ73853.1 hypothetical protein [Kineococcus vitellinus]
MTMSCEGRQITFDTFTGSGVTSDPVKRRRGGMGPQRAYGAPSSTEDVTVSKPYEDADVELRRYMYSRVGKARVVISKQALDLDGNAFGRAEVYTGILSGVTPGEVDSDSNEVEMWEAMISVDGSVG